MLITLLLPVLQVLSLIGLILIPMFIFPPHHSPTCSACTKAIQLNAIGSTMTERFDVAGRCVHQLYRQAARRLSCSWPGLQGPRDQRRRALYAVGLRHRVTLLTLLTAVVYGVGGSLVVRGAFEFGTLVGCAAARPRIRPIGSLSNVQIQVIVGAGQLDRVCEVLTWSR